MSVSGTTSSNAAASDRILRAIDAARPAAPSAGTKDSKATSGGAKAAPDATPAPSDLVAPAPRTTTSASRSSSTATADAARGAKAAPDAAATGADAASNGASQVMGAGQPGTSGAGVAPAPVPSGADTGSDPSVAPDPTAMPDRTVEPIQGTGSWSPEWQRRFEKLQLAPADVQYLAQSGYSDDQLFDIAMQLDQVEPVGTASADPYAVDPYTGAPVPGVDAGSVASANGPLPQDVAGQPGGSALNEQWAQRFGDVMSRMGMSRSEVEAQLKGVQGQPTTEEQLAEAYRQMEASVGDFTPAWKDKFTKVMGDLKTPKAEQDQVLQQLASGGLTEEQLTQAYQQMQDSAPGWNAEYEDKFKSLAIPEEMLKQLKDSGAPKSALDAQFKQLVDTKMEYKKDGRLEKLEDADASAEEKWGVMLQGTKGEEFDKVVEQIHSAHVPFWKRALSFGVNLIPGVYALQYITGKDWVTSEKIDRSNPLNIVGAVASGFAGFTAVRGALSIASSAGGLFQGLQGASMLGKTVVGGTQMAANAANTAKNGAAILNAASTGSKAAFQLKAVLGSVARVGTWGNIASASRTWGQTASFAASTMAAKNLADGAVGIDKATRLAALDSLRATGGSVSDALRATKPLRSAFENGARFADDAAFARSTAATFRQAGGFWTMNPFKNRATAEVGTAEQSSGIMSRIFKRGAAADPAAGPTAASAVRGPVIDTGRSLNFGTNGGFALGNGTLDMATGVRGGQGVAAWAQQMGTTPGFRSLLQLSPNARSAAGAVNAAEYGGQTGYEVARTAGNMGRKFGAYVATPIIGGAAVGMTGKQMQPMWEWYKNRDEIQAREAQQAGVADQEAKELERLYAEQHGGAAPAGGQQQAGTAQGGGTPATGSAQVVGTSPTGGQLVFDQQMNAVIDTSNGDVYDPTTQQLIGNLAQLQGQQLTPTAQSVAGNVPASAPAGAATGGGANQVYVDQATGMYVDPTTGLKADPNTGNVYDAQGNVVGNLNQAA